MLKLEQITLLGALALACTAMPAGAQGADDKTSAGDTGAQARWTDTTWQDVQQTPAYGNYDPGLGNTFTTGTQGVYDFNGPMLPPAATSLEAPKSGLAGPIPSGQFNYGFPNSGYDIYRGAYQGAANFGGFLPPTSTSSVDLNTVDLGGGVNNSAPTFQQGQGPGANINQPGWGFPGQDGGGVQAAPPIFPQ
jgi:hypothetical protein